MTISQIKQKLSYAAIALVGGLGVTFSIITFALVHHANRQEAREAFQADAEERYAVIKRELGSNLLMVEAVQAFFEHADVVIRPEFHNFTQHFLFRHSAIQALAWAPRIPAADRAAYEQTVRRGGLPGYQITDRTAEGSTVRAGARTEYFPAHFVEPLERNAVMLGFDMASEAVRRTSLERARDTGLMTATPGVTLLIEKGGQYGVVIFAPVYRRGARADTIESRRRNLKGFAVGVIRIKDIVDISISYLDPAGVDTFISDGTAPGNEQFLYEHQSRQHEPRSSPAETGTVQTGPLSYSKKIDVAGRTWLVSVKPTPEYARGGKHWLPWAVLSAGLAFTLFLTNYLYAVAGHTREIGDANELLRHENEERKRAEAAVVAQKRFAEDLMEHSAVATFVLDPQHRVVAWNKACEELTGVPASAMIGTDGQWRPFYDHKRPSLADVVIDADFGRMPELYDTYTKSALAPNALHAEGWYPDLNGRDRYILFDAAPLHDGTGTLIAAVETLQDITERKRAEDRLLDSESTLRAIADTAPDAIILIDDKGKIIYWNPSASRILGYGSEEIIGRHISTIIPGRYREQHETAFNNFTKTGHGSLLGKTYEVFALRKDGIEIPIELSISAILIKGRWHSAGIVRDVSERRKLEGQLRQAQKMEAIGQLAAGIAHDFNNILSAIMGFGHLVRMKMKESDPLRPNVEQMLEAADRAAHLTRGLLAFGRKQMLIPRPVDLNTVIQRVLSLLKRTIGEDIELKTAFEQEAVMVNSDAGQLEQVFMNLATNARDAMPDGGSFTIETDTLELDAAFIRAHGYGEPGTYVRVSVTDTGAGMDAETQKHIFEPFFTTKETGRGTGLGLSMAYGIIKQHNGYINVYSEPGRGTTFKIYLPLLKGAEAELEQAARHAPAKELPRGTETVLVAEDDGALRKLCRIVLEEFGYRVIAAEDGDDAVRKFGEQKDVIRLAVLDMIMPKKSGKEAYEEIKKIRPDLKVIFMSGYTAEKIFREGTLDKSMGLLLKPIVPDDLVRKVREVLDS